MNKKYIIDLTEINPAYQEDVEGYLEELLTDIVGFANSVRIIDITDDEE